MGARWCPRCPVREDKGQHDVATCTARCAAAEAAREELSRLARTLSAAEWYARFPPRPPSESDPEPEYEAEDYYDAA